MVFPIFLIIFALFGIIRAGKSYRAHTMSRHWFMLWSLFWTFVIVVAFVPSMADAVAGAVGAERGADLLVYIAVLVLMYATFRSMVLTQKLHEEQTELVRRIAIDRATPPEGA
ncbi:DUF2304 family protein [Candidatus Uhrbacteria bacterium]|nr:DUF2304 family protein [Candidatus Uhrbacteria bacterium]